MKEETTRLSASLEDYLKEIYLLNLEGQEVRITDIARSLGISKPSAVTQPRISLIPTRSSIVFSRRSLM